MKKEKDWEELIIEMADKIQQNCQDCFRNPFDMIDIDSIAECANSFSDKVLVHYAKHEKTKNTLNMIVAFVAMELPNAEQTMYNIVKLLNSLIKELNSDQKFVAPLFLNSEFSYLQNKYMEFDALSPSDKNQVLIEITKELIYLGYDCENGGAFVEPI